MRHLFFLIFLLLYLKGFSQDNLKNITVGMGAGLIHYPEGKIYGYTHNYHFDYLFSDHFGTKFSVDLGSGQKNEEFYFDVSKSTIFGVGLVYIPLSKNRNFNINTSFTIHMNTRISGTKDEILNSHFALSDFTSFETLTFYGLNLGIQYPIIQNNQFLYAIKFDAWASWLKIDAMSLKFLVGYNF